MSKILDLYTNMLEFAGCSIDQDDYIKVSLTDKPTPFLVEGKNAVLPTKKHLANAIDKVLFHPLRENLMRNESEVLKTYRKVLTLKLNITAAAISQSLLLLASSPDLQKKLNAEQNDICVALGDVDAKALETFIKINIAASKQDPYKTFVSIYNRRGGTLYGKKHARVCIASFPIYEALLVNEDKVFGVKIRNKDRDIYLKLMQYIYPGIDQQDSFSSGSDSRVAPFLESLLDTGKKLAGCYNDVLDKYRDYIDESDKLVFNSDWVEAMYNLDELQTDIRMIPVQAGNEGSADEKEVVVSAPTAKPAPVQIFNPPVQQPVPVQQPIHQAVPAPQTPGHKPTMKELLMKTSNPPMQQMGSTMMPNMPQPYPGMPPQYPGMMPQPYPGMMPQYAMPPQQRVPTWAQPGAVGPMVQPQYPGMMPGMMPGMGSQYPNMAPQYPNMGQPYPNMGVPYQGV